MIRLEDIFVVFDSGEPLERTALREINLEIKLGDKISLIGNNGSGKSTLLRLLAGHVSSSFGKIFFDKNNITDQPMNKRALDFSIVSPDYNINCFDNLTVIENLILSSFITKEKMSFFDPAVSKSQIEIVEEFFYKYDFLDLREVLFASVKDISYEQRQALCLMTVLMRPSAKVLLVDDFAYGLKEDTCLRLWKTLKQIIVDNNLTTIAVLDNPNYDANFFNRTIILSNGKIVLDAAGNAKNNIDFSKIFSNFNIVPSLKNVVTKEVMLT